MSTALSKNLSKTTPKKASKSKEGLFIKGPEEGGIEEYTYAKNGLRILFIPMPGTDTVTVNLTYLVGSRHEQRGKTGMAHMLEHMLFKDTRDKNGKRQKPKHIALQNKGASLNATTWDDRTNYYFVMPAEYLDEILQAESERMRGLILNEAQFKPEQQNVLSEYEMYADRPDFILGGAVASLAFTSHGYGHDTLGHKPDIAGLTAKTLKEFYDTFYWPNNAYLIVAGDITQETLCASVHKNFAHISHSPQVIPDTIAVEPPHVGMRTVHIEHQSPLALITCAFPAPRARDKEWIAAQVLLSYLVEGKLSPLYKALVETNKASSLSCGLMPSFDPHVLTISATVTKGHPLEEIRTIIFKALNRVRTKKISARDLTRVKNKLLADTLFSRDGTTAVTHELNECVAAGDWRLYHKALKDIEGVTAEDLQHFATEWLTDAKAIVGTFKGTQS